MVLLQPKLNLKVSQKQILTPGLVQMVSVLALNKLELKDMIYAEMEANPVLEELESPVPLLDDIAREEEGRERQGADNTTSVADGEQGDAVKDPFDEIDFGSFFQDYLDPGYRSPDWESVEKPSFENFLSSPTRLSDHLSWQLGSLNLRPEVREAAELVVGNLEDDGYLSASDDELMAAAEREALGLPAELSPEAAPEAEATAEAPEVTDEASGIQIAAVADEQPLSAGQEVFTPAAPVMPSQTEPPAPRTSSVQLPFTRDDLREAVAVVQRLDPVGVAARDLRECLLVQIDHHRQLVEEMRPSELRNGHSLQLKTVADAASIVDTCLKQLQNKQFKEIARAINCSVEDVMRAIDFIRTLDPKPGARYNQENARLIEPDVAFVKQGDEWYVIMNEDDLPQLRLNPAYRRLLTRDSEKDVRTYVKERFKSAIQLIKNIEQRKQTIYKVCYAIIGRQRDFLDKGLEHLKPMMIKEVAEEIGVHPSTVSRAVAGKYVHTQQGVFELRYFFSESVQGPEGGGTPLLLLKRRVKKLIEDEDPAKPLTDEQITRILQSQGIQVTRRTVAKYREDMKIPSTHQRRVKE